MSNAKRRWWLLGLGIGVALVGLATFTAQALRANPKLAPAQIEATMLQAQQLMQQHALHGAAVDWEPVLRHARQTAQRTQRLADLEEALQGMVWPLQQRDSHSQYIPVAAARRLQSAAPKDAAEAVLLRLADVASFPVLRMPEFGSSNAQRSQTAAAAGARLLAELLAAKPCGLVLDLRDNMGGNMYPMLEAVAALLPPKDIGYFQDRDGVQTPWPLPTRTAPPADVAVAVLIGPHTASSGEFVAIGLRSLPRTRSFGRPSFGVATGVQPVVLAHGGVLAITSAVALDHRGLPVHGPLAPDVDSDDPLRDATAWLHSQCA